MGFALFGVLVFGALAIGRVALPGVALVVALGALVWWLFRRGRPGMAVLVALAAQGVAPAAVYLAAEVEEQRVCGEAERRALKAVAHVGGARPRVSGEIDRDGCVVRYRANVPPPTAVGHYRRTLRAGGWLVLGQGTPGLAGTTGELAARRRGLRVWVSWADEGTSTRLSVTVAR